ncbi:hypothetical protein FOVG_14579 [Fusarium oxysporum f. sp. pisi HDV247]|uniref:Uncharacterized protein n=1 Tax=Fusarium oxysporum f. sp. pisi HDV247 TaxID=1080344 RepID=W9NVW8_FUSOX|nr:hypothetical protein FOVG_14579 [Fusarium oxysporum f. sp. pisi HDV247]
MSTSVKELLLVPSDAMTLHGKVLGADATATTYLLNCPPDAESCERNGQTITLGPWAEKTLASSADPTGTTGEAEGTESVSKETGSSTATADAPAESNGGSRVLRFSLAAGYAGLLATMALSL